MIDNAIQYKAEVVRKGIHLCSLSIPIIYHHLTRQEALVLLVPLAFLFLMVDITRYYHKPTAEIFYKFFRPILRSHEQNENQKRLNGATYVLLSAALCVAIFPKIIFLTAFSILIISDSVAALIGRKFGKKKFFSKSVEGSFAFFLSACIVVLVAPKLTNTFNEYAIGFFAAAVGAVVEALSITIDDNFSIPISVGSVMWIGYILFHLL